MSNEEPDYSVAEVRSVTFALTIEVYSVVLSWSRIKKVGRSKPRGLDTPLIRRVLVCTPESLAQQRAPPTGTNKAVHGRPPRDQGKVGPGSRPAGCFNGQKVSFDT